MGYDVHISRTEDWTQSESDPISLAEWVAYVRSDAEMRLDGQAAANLGDGSELLYENEGLAVWSAYSQARAADDLVWFDYQDGRVVVKNPDDEILKKMCRIASALNALVVGDVGEQYDGASRPDVQGGRKAGVAWRRRLFFGQS